MTSLETIKNYLARTTGDTDEVINIEDAFIISPKTPVPESKVSKMEIFDKTVITECIIGNIRIQHMNCQGGLTRLTWCKFLDFLSKDFNESNTLKIYLQILVQFSKIFIEESTSRSFGFPGMGKLKFFDFMLNKFLDGSLEEISEDSLIRQMENQKARGLKQRLMSKSIIEAIKINISALNLPKDVHIDFNYISMILESGCIYETINFNPFDSLRGASIHNGIFICIRNIARTPSKNAYHADLLTLAVHEFSHFIVRLVYNDLNLSSPYSNRSLKNPRFDFGLNKRPLEIGRNTELLLFDGIQPDWKHSGGDAATVFLQRVDSNCSTLPIISKGEFEILGLSERVPSTFFGIDVNPGIMMFD